MRTSFLINLICVAALLVIIGCEKATVSSDIKNKSVALRSTGDNPKETKEELPPSEIPVVNGRLIDGFEGPEYTVWAFDSADDEPVAQYVSEGATQGKKALKITLREKGFSGKIDLRRDVFLDLSHAESMVVDIASPSDKLSVALACKVGPHETYQESRPVALKEGMNYNVRFPLVGNNWKNEKTKWEFAGPPVNLQALRRVSLLFFTGQEAKGSFLVDNLRVEENESDAKGIHTFHKEWRPEGLVTTGLPDAINQNEPIEIKALFRASYRDIFDPNELQVGMRVYSPSGKVLEVRGFFGGILPANTEFNTDSPQEPVPFWGPFRKPKLPPPQQKDKGTGAKKPEAPKPELTQKQKDDLALKKAKAQEEARYSNRLAKSMPVWLIRFTPQEVGRYTVQFYVRNNIGELRLPERFVTSAPERDDPAFPGRHGGNVRVSKRDPRQLELANGEPFYIYGQNVCWSHDWKPYFAKMKDYGANTLRIWFCPWGIKVEKKTEPNVFDLQQCERVDEILREAEKTGVRVIMCFTFHGANQDFWHESPYNAENGGPCARAEDFFTDNRAKRQYKRLLSYAAMRWGSSPGLLSWELMNEMDLAKYDYAEEVAAWAKEMAGHLKSADTHGHLVTTSVTNPNFPQDVWNDPRIDFISFHTYGTDTEWLVRNRLNMNPANRKPILLAEYGGGTNAHEDIPDQNGERLKAGLWLTACSPACGAALPWWWDTYIETRNLYPVLAAAKRFVAGEDRRGRFTEWVRKRFDDDLTVTGSMDAEGARFYVHRPEWTKNPELRKGSVAAKEYGLDVTGLTDGAYKVEYWDAAEGKIFSTVENTSSGGKLRLKIPEHAVEYGIKIDRKTRAKLGLQ